MKIEITGTPFEMAKKATAQELKKLIRDCNKALSEQYDEFTDRCRICFEKYAAGEKEQAQWWSNHAQLVRPEE